jgi:zinc protease
VPVIGYQEVIRGLTRDDVYSYYRQAYQPNNMIFAVAGDIDPEQMLSAVRKNFAAAPAGRVFNHDIAAEPPVAAPRTVVGTFPALGQARLKLGFPTVSIHHPDLFALDLLAQVLGGGDSSLLVEEVRDKRQLASAIGVVSNTPGYADGTFEVVLQLEPAKLGAATDAVLEELEKVKAGEIDEQRIARAKALVRANRVRQLQTPEDVVSSMATDLLTSGDPHFSDRYVRQIQEVSAVQLATVARRYLDRNRLLTTALLPAEFVGAGGLPKAEDVIRPTAPTTRQAEEQPASQIVRSELPDGTILLAKRISTSPLVVVQMMSLGGLSVENEQTNGLGNLTMEMLPRGTATRSAQDIAQFFDSIGGELATGTGERQYGGNNTWYWTATCLKDDLPKALEVFADVVHNPSFPDGEVESMKRRVLADIAGQDADWLQQSLRFFRRNYYGPMRSPYQFMPVGTAENVSGFTQQQMRDWYAQKVLAGKRVLAIFGDVDPATAKKLASDLVAKGPKRPATRRTPTTRPASTAPAATQPSSPAFVDVQRVEVQKTGQALAGVLVGYRADSYLGDPANDPLAVADTMTSGYGYPTGYLHEILRGRGLVYVVHAINSPGLNRSLPGTFFVYAGCDAKNVNEVVDVILENIARLQGTPADVNEEWFRRSKELAAVSDALMRQTPGDQASAAALDELCGLGYDYHLHFADRVKAVSLPDVREVSRARLTQCVVTVSTPDPEAVSVKKGRREYRSFPPVDLTPRGVQHDAGGAK